MKTGSLQVDQKLDAVDGRVGDLVNVAQIFLLVDRFRHVMSFGGLLGSYTAVYKIKYNV